MFNKERLMHLRNSELIQVKGNKICRGRQKTILIIVVNKDMSIKKISMSMFS
jgi:hypothetical protein